MDLTSINSLVSTTPILMLGLGGLVGLFVAALLGFALKAILDGRSKPPPADGQEGYIVSAVLGLLALLMGFTFALAVDRFDTRRAGVLEEANAIGTTYLRTQLLNEPHRARISDLLVRYVDNRIVLAKALPRQTGPLLAINDEIITDLWAATSAAFVDIKGLDFSSAYLESMNYVIDMDASRKAARAAHVPITVFVVLGVYLIVTAGVLGYVLTGWRGRLAAVFLLALLVLSLMLIIDLDRPNVGGIRESQAPMERLLASMRGQPSSVYDRWLVDKAVETPRP